MQSVRWIYDSTYVLVENVSQDILFVVRCGLVENRFVFIVDTSEVTLSFN